MLSQCPVYKVACPYQAADGACLAVTQRNVLKYDRVWIHVLL